MIWADKLKYVKPEKIHYLSDCLVIDGIKYPCERPRLEFLRALSCYPEPKGPFIEYESMLSLPKMGMYCTIGAAGFGYERNEDGVPLRMPHLGKVKFGAGVELGNLVNIDRAVLGYTYIGDNVKIDSHVHIAHGARIGKNTMIVDGAVIGGSSEIGEGCYIGMGALIKNKVRIGKHVTIGMGAVVLKDVADGETIIGNPGRPLKKEEPVPHFPIPAGRVKHLGRSV